MLRKTARIASIVLIVSALGAMLAACGSDQDLDITKLGLAVDPPKTLYNQGLANMKAGKMEEAARKFEAVDRQHPFSDWSRKALVMNTYVKYRSGRYTDAVMAGKRYLRLYPKSHDSAYVLYLIGLSYWKQIPTVTQDQQASSNTIIFMKALVKDYPKSEYVEDAQTKVRFATNQLAGKQMQIGRYYLERRQYLAAIQRFRNVVETYPRTSQIEEAMARLVETYYAIGLVEEAQAIAAVLGHNYPDSPWYADSYALLKRGGVEPRENSKSWISQMAKKLRPHG